MQAGLRKWIFASLVGSMLLTGASSAQADYLFDARIGLLTVGSNVFYVPVKLGYAVLGGLTGSFAYVAFRTCSASLRDHSGNKSQHIASSK